nr:hypothetical protein [Tanacetum cinerariifolium]
MTWHATGKCTKPGKMQHLVDGGAWKNFDTKYLDFAEEPRNVRLGLATDGFNPFDNLSKDIGVYLRPFIDDLKNLWAKPGVETIDVATCQKFNMRAMVLWTINDFFARSSLSGWIGQGYRACPTCNKDTPSVRVLGRTDYVGHKRFLKKCHKWMSSLDFNGEIKDGDPPREFSRDKIMTQLARLPTRVKAQRKVIDILCNLELIYPSAFFDIMIHLVIHLPLEAIDGGPIRPREFPNKDMQEEFLGWFGKQIRQCHVDNDPYVSESSELFALSSGPSQTPISVNSCVVNGVRFIVHSRDELRSTQNNSICSPGLDGEMYYDVARGHRSYGGGDDHPPPYQIPIGCEGCLGHPKPNLDSRRAGRMHTRQETRNLWLKAITDKNGSVSIRFEFGDIETLMPLGDYAAHWVNYLGELVKELPLHYPSWRQMPPKRKAGVVEKIGTHFDLRTHMESDHLPKIYVGI